jgi:hypothetical protein
MRFAIACAVLGLAASCEQRILDDVQLTRASARAIQRAAETWRAEHPERCPNVEQLHRDKHLDTAQSSSDAWGSAFVIQCQTGVAVRSWGPDRLPGTADDIMVP